MYSTIGVQYTGANLPRVLKSRPLDSTFSETGGPLLSLELEECRERVSPTPAIKYNILVSSTGWSGARGLGFDYGREGGRVYLIEKESDREGLSFFSSAFFTATFFLLVAK